MLWLISHSFARKKFLYDSLPSAYVLNVLKRKFSNFETVPTQARVIIAGAGVVANSVAYHLVNNGWTDVLVLEQEKIGSGTSHFGSGTLGLFKPIADRNIILYSIELYRKLQEMGYDVGIKQCGSVNLAQSKDRLIALRRRMAYNLPTGLYCQIVSKKELKQLHPYLRVDNIEGAIWVPEDGVADPKAICDTLATLARKGGARYIENCKVDFVLSENSKVKGVITEQGTISCEYFVNCAGMWARDLGLCCNPPVKIPAHPADHYYVIANNLFDSKVSLPCVRDFDSHMYARQYRDGLMIGWFEKEATPAYGGESVERNWKKTLQINNIKVSQLYKNACKRIPVLESAKNPIFTNSPDNFTPDGRWIIGESADLGNYFVAVGMNGNSLQGAGGIGKAVAEWIIEGEPTQELIPFSIQRFLDLHNNRKYLQKRVKEVVGRHYSILYPYQSEYKYARMLRCSPLYTVLKMRGAVFGIKMAYERALYFDSTYKHGQPYPAMPHGSFYKPKFFDFMKEEYLACRETVGIIDMSSFSKIEIKSGSSDVVDYLQKLCSNEVNIPIGSIVHTGMQNEHGGYENDCMLVRKTENCFFMVSPSNQQTRIYDWMSKNLPTKHSITLNDVTSMYTVINVVGPKASGLLSELSMSKLTLHPFTYKTLDIGYASDVMVMAFTHTGEPGYCLYVPSEYALHIYDRLMTIGRDYGVRDVGTLAQRWMRIEKFIPFWAEELTSFTTPFEAGNAYNVKLNKENFIGKNVLRDQKECGVTKRLVMFHLNNIDPDKDIWPWGGEPIYRNNEFVGTVTSAGYGFTTDKLICLGFIRRPQFDQKHDGIVTSEYVMARETIYYIDIAGQRIQATPYLHPPHNTSGKRQSYKPKLVTYKSEIVN